MTELLSSTGAVSSSNKNETNSSTITTTGENMMERNNDTNNFNFDINAIHNGEHCIASLDPRDTRENKFWFTIAMFCTIYGVAEQTLRDNLKSLGDDGELGLHEISGRRINIKDSCGILNVIREFPDSYKSYESKSLHYVLNACLNHRA